MPNYPQSLVFLELLAGYVICLLVAVIGLVVVWKLATGQIDLSTLLHEKDGSKAGASMARFQLLVFIFVIALSFFLVVISNIKIVQYRAGERGVPVLPEVPRGVLLLLGISTSGYAVGKAIQHGAGTGQDEAETDNKDKK
jgi:hypothetical protein